MAKTINVYGKLSPLVDGAPVRAIVDAAPVRARDILRCIDPKKYNAGGQGRFCRLEGWNGLGAKFFKVKGIDADVLKSRAKRVSNALTILSQTPPSDPDMFKLFNQLNVPKRPIVADDGRLVGLVVPVAPPSCYISHTINGKRANKLVELRYAVWDQHLIHVDKNSDDSLEDAAKWSILDSLCQTIASFHDLHLVHGDLSSSNVLIRWAESNDPKVYVIDAFNGLSDSGGNRELGHMLSDVYCPTSVKNCEYTTASDVYCLAWWVMHIAVAADPNALRLPRPNFYDSASVKRNLFLRHEYVVKHLPDARRKFPKWLYQMLISCIDTEPKDRPNTWELAYAVHDYWLGFGDER